MKNLVPTASLVIFVPHCDLTISMIKWMLFYSSRTYPWAVLFQMLTFNWIQQLYQRIRQDCQSLSHAWWYRFQIAFMLFFSTGLGHALSVIVFAFVLLYCGVPWNNYVCTCCLYLKTFVFDSMQFNKATILSIFQPTSFRLSKHLTFLISSVCHLGMSCMAHFYSTSSKDCFFFQLMFSELCSTSVINQNSS